MIILRNKFFSDKEKKDETKLKVVDRLDIWSNKHLENTEQKRKYLKGEANPFSTRDAVLIGAGSGSVLAMSGDTPVSAVLNKKYRKAAALSVGGAAIHPVINKVAGSANKKVLEKNPHAHDRSLDRLDVAEGKMSKEEFAKKWYKDKKKEDKAKKWEKPKLKNWL
jgi:hypothetical protein